MKQPTQGKYYAAPVQAEELAFEIEMGPDGSSEGFTGQRISLAAGEQLNEIDAAKAQVKDGINKIKHNEYRMLTTVAIYIPNPRVALKMLQACENREKKKRPRAIDTMLRDAFTSQYVYYPAPVIERKCESTIRKGSRNKFCNEFYEWKKK